MEVTRRPHEELLLIILVIPEKKHVFQSDLGLFRGGKRRRTCAWFLSYFDMYISLFFYRMSIKMFVFSSEAETCCFDANPFIQHILTSLSKFCIEIPIEKLENDGTVS